MRSDVTIALLLAASGWLAGPVQAQAVYRCGDSYSQQPCPGGKEVQVEDSRTAAQRLDTSQAAQREAKTADAMEKARLKEEAKVAPAGIPPGKATDGGESAVKPVTMVKPKKPEQFTAVAPRKASDTQAKKKKKAKARPKKSAA